MEAVNYLHILVSLACLYSVHGRRQRGDIEIPEFPFLDYQHDNPAPDPPLKTTTTASPIVKIKPTTATAVPVTSSPTTITSSTVRPTLSTKPTWPTMKLPKNLFNVDMSKQPPPIRGDNLSKTVLKDSENSKSVKTLAKDDLITSARKGPSAEGKKDDTNNSNDMTYIIIGATAGGVAVIGGIAITLGVLASKGKLGQAGFEPVATNV